MCCICLQKLDSEKLGDVVMKSEIEGPSSLATNERERKDGRHCKEV